ncbi:hypothetical protein [Kitasatospora sp. NPDC057223]|uniref:hypothetical protein n=1 Tax=Kitasatospora sp. NPDC057223 TaxID=3346055 RepID=UPI00364167CB
MNLEPWLPGRDQYDALRSFVTARQRELGREQRQTGAGPEARWLAASWLRTAWKYTNLINFATEHGQPYEAARAWAVMADLLIPWAQSPQLPEALRGITVAASRAPLNPWEPSAR